MCKELSSLKGRVALVTGRERGLRRGTVLALMDAGSKRGHDGLYPRTARGSGGGSRALGPGLFP
jgi:hypothetical protein